jgi:phthiocerol/phenolphthiocerol synthesis type-I polyketide synthase E
LAGIDKALSTSPLESLSPARRKLLDRLLKERGLPTAESRPEHPVASESVEPTIPADAASTDVSKVRTKSFYDTVTRQLDSSMFGSSAFFLNLGYAPVDGLPRRSPIDIPKHALDANSVMLVLELVGDCSLSGKRVLDVGCGRGGTIVTLLRYCDIARATGMDLSTEAVMFCRRRHRFPHAQFANGDAERLPFADASFDAVTNIESSHTYPTVESFYREVHRVLAPGGPFLYGDVFFDDERKARALRALEALGFVVEREDDVTPNVVLSCDQVAERRQEAFKQRSDVEMINNFLATPGSGLYDALKTGSASFWLYRLRRR